MKDDEPARKAFAMGCLKNLLLRHLPEDGVFPTAMPGLNMARRNQAGFSEHRFEQPLASLLVQGSKTTVMGASRHTILPGQILLAGLDMPSSSQILEASPESPLLTIFFHINQQMAGELILELGWREKHGPPARGMAVADAEVDFVEAILALARMLDKPEQIPVRAPIVLRDLHYLLLTGPMAGVLHDIYGSGRYGRQLFAAIEYLKSHLDMPVSSAELARAAYMSESTLYRHFKTLTGLSPMQYHKQLRLHEARKLILGSNEQAGMAAMKVGYESVAQFNREYKRLFGQTPYRSRKSPNDA